MPETNWGNNAPASSRLAGWASSDRPREEHAHSSFAMLFDLTDRIQTRAVDLLG